MAFRVDIAGSQHYFEANEGELLLDAALSSGISIPYGCRGGGCGACKAELRAGEVRYSQAPLALTEAEIEAGAVLPCVAEACSDLELAVREVQSQSETPVRLLPARIARKQLLSHDVLGVWLELPKTERLQFLAGQYIDIVLRDGRHRSFSLANAPHNDALLELHVRRVPGGEFTGRLFDELKEKSVLRIQGPLGSFYAREDSPRPMILMAGGTGLAPIKSIVEHLLAASCTRPMHVFWGVRSEADLYDRVLAQWQQEYAQLSYTEVLSEPDASSWSGASGYVHEHVLEAMPTLSACDVYMAGPPPMINAAKAAFLGRGLPEERLYFDSFEYGVDVPAS